MRIGVKLTVGFLVIASIGAIVGSSSYLTNRRISVQVEQLGRSSIVGVVDSTNMMTAWNRAHAACHELIEEKRLMDAAAAGGEAAERFKAARAEIDASLRSFSRSLVRSQQSVESLIDWSRQNGADLATIRKHQQVAGWLRELAAELDIHRKLVERFQALVEQDREEALTFLEGDLESHFNEVMLPLIQKYDENAQREFTQRVRSVERAIQRANVRNMTITVIVIIAAVALGLFMARSIGRPLARLKEAATRIGEGRFDVPVDVTSRDEFGVLAEAFREMQSALQTTTVSRSYVNNIIQSMSEMLIAVDRSLRIELVNRAAQEELGFDEGELLGKPLGDLARSGELCLPGEARLAAELANGMESHLTNSQGVEIPVYVRSAELRGDDGQLQGVVCIAQNITQQRLTAQRLKASLAEKDVLLKEVHHRVKNNLQIVSSLLNLQAGAASDPETIRMFRDSQSRIRTMALIHEQLYRSEDLNRIDFAEYVQRLVEQLKHTYDTTSRSISIRVDVQRVPLDLDTAIPCGMIVNELVSNAMDHAFTESAGGEVEIRYDVSEDRHTLTVRDNGVGLPEEIVPAEASTLGLKVVGALARQLDGELSVARNHGTQFVISYRVNGRQTEPSV